MLYNNDFSSKMYERLSDLEEKLLKSEAERKLLEAKFQFMADSYKTEEERRLNNLRKKYTEFMEDCKERSRRNDDILKSLQKVENGANAVYAKTERLKQLRSHYDAYLSRANPLWRHPDVLQLQAPDTTQRAPWIREPRMNMAVTRPALLLPGGGAVMLPVDESGMTVPLGPHPGTHVLAPDSEVRKLRLSESIASAKDAKIISTLGEAGQRMIKELKLIEGSHYSYLLNSPKMQPAPVFYQSYHLPVYIPPMYGSTAVCAPPIIDYTPQVISPTLHSQPVKTEANRSTLPERKLEDGYKKKNVLSTEDRKKDRFEKPKDNFEIECLAADGTYVEEDDANLSDDEVLDVALGRSQSPFRNENTKPEWTNHQTTPHYSENAARDRDPKYEDKHFENVTPVAKKIVVAHQKSIEELKAMLSFEEDEDAPPDPVKYSEPDGGYTVDEDVPEEFTEQNYQEPNYDSRFQRDVSRNVILEEDEEEEEEKPVITREDEWRRSQERSSFNNQADPPRMHVERLEPRKSPQQYAQQFKALIKSRNKPIVFEEPTPAPPQIQRQASRVVVTAAPHEQEDTYRYDEPDPNLVTNNGFSYERNKNPPQGQTAKDNEFASMSNRHEDLNMERDDFSRDKMLPGEFHVQPVYDPEYDANFEQPQQFENSNREDYETRMRYEEPNPVEQYQDYQAQPRGDYYEEHPAEDYVNPEQRPLDDYQSEPREEYYEEHPAEPYGNPEQRPLGDYQTQPREEYYEENPAEPYSNPEQRPLGDYQPGEPMLDYYPEPTENDNRYPEQPLENYPQNEFYEGEMNQPQYDDQYVNYEADAQADTQFYNQQQVGYTTEEAQRVDNIAEPHVEGLVGNQRTETSANGGTAPRPSILNQLLDSESESYQVDPAGSAPDDSDFDFSIGKP